MYPTFVQVKDVLFHSYFEPYDHENETLFLSFRLQHMMHDELIMDIQRDEYDYLYTTNIVYFDASRLETIDISEKFDEEELSELLKALLNDSVTMEELKMIDWEQHNGCYAIKEWLQEE